MPHALEIQDVARSYGDNQALQAADLHLDPGEIVALLGPNGAGKTTLIRSIAGRLKLDRGTIKVQGIEQQPGGRKDVSEQLGVIPQDIALYETLTAVENLELFGKLSGVSKSDLPARIEESLEWTGLHDRRDDVVKTFSGGMKRRLNIACGVIHHPSVILLDEPTVGVDPQSRERIREMLMVLREREVSILLTTHQLDEAQQVADRIVIIDHGKTIATGSFEQLLEQSIGCDRRVILTVSADVDQPPGGFQKLEDRKITQQVSDIASDLPRLLEAASSAGHVVTDVSIQSPDLQAVFLHFTGRELRE